MIKVVIVDRTVPSWITRAMHLLALSEVECMLIQDYDKAYAEYVKTKADLIVVNSPSVGDAEKRLIFLLMKAGCPVVVTSVDIPAPLMREIFRAGGIDVADYVNTATDFAEVIFAAFRRSIPRPEAGYQEQERILNAERH